MTASLGIVIMPWKLLASTSSFLNVWLIGYSALLGPVIGVVMSDYFVVRQRQLDVDALYSSDTSAAYWYKVRRAN